MRAHNTCHYLNYYHNHYGWGVIKCTLDELALHAQLIKILEFEAILPDYSVLIVPIYAQDTLELNLSQMQLEDKEYTVYLSLNSAHNLDTPEEHGRYHSTLSNHFVDLNQPQNLKQIIKLKPNPILTLNPNHLNQNLPILKFVMADGGLLLSEYDPPAPNFHCLRYTKDRLTLIVSKLTNKLELAYTQLRFKNLTNDFREYGYLLLRGIWPLNAALQQETVNPHDIYMHLVQLAALLATIPDSIIPPYHAKYDHNKILESFDLLYIYIEQKISTINKMYSLSLNKFNYNQESNQFSMDLPFNFKIELKILLHFNKDVDYKQWINSAIIASDNTLEFAKVNRTLGCAREILDTYKINPETLGIILQVSLSTLYIKSKTLCIINQIEMNSCPKVIYLLDD